MAILGLAAIIMSNFMVIFLKYIIAEPRPFLTLPHVDLLTTENGSSFPSGHTASSFAVATAIGLKYYKRGQGKYWLIYPLLLFSIVVGFSRVYVGVHYPYDVFFGALMGILCGLFIIESETQLLGGRIAHLFRLNKLIALNPLEKVKEKLRS